MQLTIQRVEILEAIENLSTESPYGVINIGDLIAYLTSERDTYVKGGKVKTYKNRDIAVRKIMVILKKAGLAENPMQGYWRLTKKGKKVLRGFP